MQTTTIDTRVTIYEYQENPEDFQYYIVFTDQDTNEEIDDLMISDIEAENLKRNLGIEYIKIIR